MAGAEPSLVLTIGSLLLGLFASALWTLTRYAITMAHEGGHALFGSLSGGTMREMRFHRGSDGLTVLNGAESVLITALAGYLAPSIFGLIGANLLAHRVSPDAILWISIVLFLIVFFQTNNWFGWFIVGLYTALFFVIVRYGSPAIRSLSAYTWIWFLLLGGVLQNALSNIREGDAGHLKQTYKMPIGFWTGLWWLANTAALIYGGGILFGLIDPVFRRQP